MPTQDVSIFDEGGDNSLTVDSDGEANIKSKIWDETNEADVTSDNKLRVEANVSALPATKVEYVVVFLENGGSKDMVVNGSSTPVVFEWTPGTGEIWYIEEIIFLISDTGSSDPGDYGSISGGITNGCTLHIRSGGIEKDIAVVKDNIDILQAFDDESFSGNGNFMGSGNTYKGVISFGYPFVIQDSTGDFIKMTINDNITGLDNQRVSVRLWREQT